MFLSEVKSIFRKRQKKRYKKFGSKKSARIQFCKLKSLEILMVQLILRTSNGGNDLNTTHAEISDWYGHFTGTTISTRSIQRKLKEICEMGFKTVNKFRKGITISVENLEIAKNSIMKIRYDIKTGLDSNSPIKKQPVDNPSIFLPSGGHVCPHKKTHSFYYIYTKNNKDLIYNLDNVDNFRKDDFFNNLELEDKRMSDERYERYPKTMYDYHEEAIQVEETYEQLKEMAENVVKSNGGEQRHVENLVKAIQKARRDGKTIHHPLPYMGKCLSILMSFKAPRKDMDNSYIPPVFKRTEDDIENIRKYEEGLISGRGTAALADIKRIVFLS